MTWNNLALWNVQIALLVVLGSLLPPLFGLYHSRARQIYWQALLAVALLLPLVQPWRRDVVVVPSVLPAAAEFVATPPLASAPVPSWGALEAVAAVLAAGVLLRAAWFAAGMLRLRRYRREARALEPVPAPVAALQRQLCAYPEIRVSSAVSGPVTFGFRDPVVLVPERFPELEPPVQAAMACHELLHVKRRDWLFTAAEELVRALFWFHPAIWWVLGQIQLSREQAVDRETVRLTGARDRYIDALLTASGARQQLDLAPAPLFLRRRHLTARIAAIVKEVEMSRRRIVGTVAACFAVLLAVGWLVSGSLPLEAAPQVVSDSAGVTITGAERVIHRSPVRYPADALAARIEGTVMVDAQLASDGSVVDAAVVSGPVELRRAALQSVLDWHFNREVGNRAQVSIRFQVPEVQAAPATSGKPPAVPLLKLSIEGIPASAAADLRARLPLQEGQPVENDTLVGLSELVHRFDQNLSVVFEKSGTPVKGLIVRILPRSNGERAVKESQGKMMIAKRLILGEVVIDGLEPAAAEELRARLPVRPGDSLNGEVVKRIMAAIREYDRHLSTMITGEPGSIVIRIGNMQAPPSLPQPAAAPGSPQRIRVGGNVQTTKIVDMYRPEYPAEAKAQGISGKVELRAVIAADGTVADVTLLSGHAMLAPAAMDAVRRWKYAPTLLNGVPVEVVTNVDVNFTLAQ